MATYKVNIPGDAYKVNLPYPTAYNQGLVGLYEFDSVAGNVLKDKVNIMGDIPLFNSPTVVTSNGRTGVLFNGTTQYGIIAKETVAQFLLGDYTVIFEGSWNTADSMVLSQFNGSTDMQLIGRATDIKLDTGVPSGGSPITGAYDTINYFCARAFVSGAFLGARTQLETDNDVASDPLKSTEDLLLGVDADSTGNGSLGNYYSGVMHRILFFNRSLTNTEVDNYFNDYEIFTKLSTYKVNL